MTPRGDGVAAAAAVATASVKTRRGWTGAAAAVATASAIIKQTCVRIVWVDEW